MGASSSDKKMSYPTLYFTCDKECEFPEEGTAKIKFRKVEDVENTRDPEKPTYRYELEVHGIEVDGMKEMDDGEDEADVKTGIKEGMKKMMKKKMGEEE